MDEVVCSSLHRTSGDSNRRILKTVRSVVWEGAGAQSPAPDPIQFSAPENGTVPFSYAYCRRTIWPLRLSVNSPSATASTPFTQT